MSVSYDFKEKKILVTGATRGIGRGIVGALASAGAEIVALGSDAENLARLSQDFPAIATVQADVADIEGTKSALKPHQPFYGLVNNAGVSYTDPFLEMPPDHFDKVMSVNLRGATFVAQTVAAEMVTAGVKGSIVNLSSAAAQGALKDHTAYCIAKAGLDALTRVMALELGPKGIRVNSINPTVVLTDMGRRVWSDPVKNAVVLNRIPLGRFVEVEEAAAGVLWLLSEQSSMTTGAAIPIEGGLWYN